VLRLPELGAGASGVLFPALLSSGALALRVGGVRRRLTLSGDLAALAPHADKYADFDAARSSLAPDDIEAALAVHCRPEFVCDAPLGPAPNGYARPDLRYIEDARGARCEIDASEGAFDAALELRLQSALHAHEGFVVHASAGVDAAGGAWLCPGPSGAGKSTFARSAGFARVLADEAVVVRRHASGWRVHGTPFWSEGRTLPYDAGNAPLTRLVRQVKAPGAWLAPLSPAAAAAHLVESVLLHDATLGVRERLFERACDAALAAQCYDVNFPKEGPWLSGVIERPAAWAPSSGRPSSGLSPSSCSGT